MHLLLISINAKYIFQPEIIAVLWKSRDGLEVHGLIMIAHPLLTFLFRVKLCIYVCMYDCMIMYV
jgi:hypothetical protein